MADTSSLILEHLKVIRADVSELKADMKDVKYRLSRIEQGQAKQHHESADHYEADARQNANFDRLAERVARIERRLDLNDETP